jgi:L-threonylcarbamoyladenylate synthase
MLDDMEGKIDAVLDGGSCQVGVESTIVDLTCQPPRLLRPGGVPLEELRDVLGEIELDPAITRPMKEGETPRAPGITPPKRRSPWSRGSRPAARSISWTTSPTATGRA